MGWVIKGGNQGAIWQGAETIVDGGFGALRTSFRPLDHTSPYVTLGHYRWSQSTAAIAPAANSVLFAARWADSARLAVLERLSASITVVTAVTAQRTDPLVASIARAYSVAESTNVAAAVAASRARATMAQVSLMGAAGNIQITNNAAGLTGGTKTVDATPFSHIAVTGLGGLGTGLLADDFLRYETIGNYAHPVVLATQEGILVLWGPTALATGTVTVNISMTWAEVVQF